MAKNGKPNTYETRNPAKLKNHPLSQKIYGDQPDTEFVESVKAHGVVVPLLVTADDRVIAGHRRRQAAIMAGLKEVRVVVRRDLTDELAIEQALILANKQRIKTTEQLAREAQRLFEIEEEFAKRRMKAGHPRVPLPKGHRESEKGRSSEKVGEAIGVSERTARNLRDSANAIDEAEASGEHEKAADIKETLNTKGAKAAADKAKGNEKPKVADADKQPVPKPLESVFAQRPAFKSVLSKLGKLKGEIDKLGETDAGARLNLNRIKVEFDNARREIRFAMPHKPCPHCRKKKSASCECCKGLAWVTEEAWKLIPEDQR